MSEESSIGATGKQAQKRQLRLFKDRCATLFVGVGGLSVIVSLLLIFFYLFYVVLPLFGSADFERSGVDVEPLPPIFDLVTDEYGEVTTLFQRDGEIRAISNQGNGTDLIDLAQFDTEVTAYGADLPTKKLFAYGLADGSVSVVSPAYKITYPNDKRHIEPQLITPLGENLIQVIDDGARIQHLTLQMADESANMFALDDQRRLTHVRFYGEESFLTDEIEWEYEIEQIADIAFDAAGMYVDAPGHSLMLYSGDGELIRFDVSDPEDVTVIERLSIVSAGEKITAFAPLSSGSSYIFGTDSGEVSQWFPVRNENGQQLLTKIRTLRHADGTPIEYIAAEPNRKVFFVKPVGKPIDVYHSTADRLVMTLDGSEDVKQFAVSNRGNKAMTVDASSDVSLWAIHNEHPEVSLKSLWGKVWYEGYEDPQYIWQSSAADSDFEAKLSLTPISFGTLKAAFYAMLFAVPLAIFGAVYTAYFMSPGLRKFVKPAIEIMEALPTVILGFLAGLWLAPFMENNLPAFFILIVSIPVTIILCAYIWLQVLPKSVRRLVPDGWHALLLVIPLCLVMWLSIEASQVVEMALFDGNIRGWLTNDLGIGFDQRNALIVGIAMGFAVIPTIFSITEDAIFSVPKQLTLGSLALGATPWQSLSRVVILTASPGIFSAVMVGLGRAVGETMIVLMATGNTPVMDFSIFEGMRTLSANIAVEMPESEVGSTHYRVLFLAGLVLFVFTFIFNTGAEVVRQRLRRKYSSL